MLIGSTPQWNISWISELVDHWFVIYMFLIVTTEKIYISSHSMFGRQKSSIFSMSRDKGWQFSSKGFLDNLESIWTWDNSTRLGTRCCLYKHNRRKKTYLLYALYIMHTTLFFVKLSSSLDVISIVSFSPILATWLGSKLAKAFLRQYPRSRLEIRYYFCKISRFCSHCNLLTQEFSKKKPIKI